MSDERYGLTDAQWNDINEGALRQAAESFAKYPDAWFKGSEVVEILNGAADANPTRGTTDD